MGKYKKIKFAHQGEMKSEIEKDLKTEIYPVDRAELQGNPPIAPNPSDNPTVDSEHSDASEHSEIACVDRMEKIAQNAKLKDEYDEVNDDLQRSIELYRSSRNMLGSAIVVFHESLDTIKEATEAMLNATKSLESIGDRLVEIMCRVEKFKFIVELDESSKALLAEHRKEIVKSESALMDAHLQRLEKKLKSHQKIIEDKIEASKGFWLSSKNGWILTGIFAMCFLFTLLFWMGYIYLKICGKHIYI